MLRLISTKCSASETVGESSTRRSKRSINTWTAGLNFVRSRGCARRALIKDYEGLLRRYVRPGLGTKALQSISAFDIQTLYGDLIARSLSARSIRYTHAVLRSALKQATRWNLILSNPADSLDLPRQDPTANRSTKRRTGENIRQGDLWSSIWVPIRTRPDNRHATQ